MTKVAYGPGRKFVDHDEFMEQLGRDTGTSADEARELVEGLVKSGWLYPLSGHGPDGPDWSTGVGFLVPVGALLHEA